RYVFRAPRRRIVVTAIAAAVIANSATVAARLNTALLLIVSPPLPFLSRRTAPIHTVVPVAASREYKRGFVRDVGELPCALNPSLTEPSPVRLAVARRNWPQP